MTGVIRHHALQDDSLCCHRCYLYSRCSSRSTQCVIILLHSNTWQYSVKDGAITTVSSIAEVAYPNPDIQAILANQQHDPSANDFTEMNQPRPAVSAFTKQMRSAVTHTLGWRPFPIRPCPVLVIIVTPIIPVILLIPHVF
jgi:hypothetical protein